MNAGASGLASVIIPMAKSFGIRVITTVLTREIANNILHLGADRVVVTTEEDISEVLKEEFENGHSVDVAIDCLGGEIMGRCLHYLTHGARWIMIASLAGRITEIDLKNIYVRNVRHPPWQFGPHGGHLRIPRYWYGLRRNVPWPCGK